MDLPHRFCESCLSKAPGIKLRPSDLVQCDSCWFGKNPGAEDLLEDPAVMKNQKLSTGTGMEATHRPRPRPTQVVGCGHSESNPVESPVCDANTATRAHRVSSYTEFSFSSSSSDDKFMNQKSPQSSSASNDSEKSPDSTNALLFDNLICKFTFVQRSGKERCMCKGTISELQDFVSLVLEIDGYWRTGKDLNHNIFKSTSKNININYWISTQTFTVNGKKEDAVMKKIKQLVSSCKSPHRQHQEELTASNRVQGSQTIRGTTPCLQGNYATPA